MIRNLKILIAGAMALAAFGTIGASGAQAAEFHCSVEPCTITVKPDGAVPGKTSHYVFIVKQGVNSLSTTCDQVSAHGTSATKTFSTLTLTNIVHNNCPFLGAPTVIRMNGCEYHVVVGGIHHATMQIKCPAGKVIEIEANETKCLITIGSTGVLTGGFTFKDAETGGVKKTEITAETTVTNIPMTVANNKCALKEGAATGEITTWNFELTADEDKSPFPHASIWWE